MSLKYHRAGVGKLYLNKKADGMLRILANWPLERGREGQMRTARKRGFNYPLLSLRHFNSLLFSSQ